MKTERVGKATINLLTFRNKFLRCERFHVPQLIGKISQGIPGPRLDPYRSLHIPAERLPGSPPGPATSVTAWLLLCRTPQRWIGGRGWRQPKVFRNLCPSTHL